MPTHINARCHGCGPVLVPASIVSARLHDTSGAATYRFDCPRCATPNGAPTSRELLLVLVGAGATLEPSVDVAATDSDAAAGEVIDLVTGRVENTGGRSDRTRRAAPQPMGVALLRPWEASTLAGVSPAELRRYEAAGRLVARRTAGGHRRYRQDDVLALRRWLQRSAS